MNKRQCEATKIFKEDLLRFKDNKNLIKKIEKTINILANDLEKSNELFFYPIFEKEKNFYPLPTKYHQRIWA